MCMDVLPACMYVGVFRAWYGGQKRARDPLDLKLQVGTESHRVGAGK